MEIQDLLQENELNFTGLALAAVSAKDVYIMNKSHKHETKCSVNAVMNFFLLLQVALEVETPTQISLVDEATGEVRYPKSGFMYL